MPKGGPGIPRTGNAISKVYETRRRARLRARFPALMKALGNLPPTPAELDRITLGEIGPAQGWLYPEPNQDKRYTTVYHPRGATRGGSVYSEPLEEES